MANSPTFLGDNLRFTLTTSTYFLLQMSVDDVVNRLQNALLDINNKVGMNLPPCHKEWLHLYYHNIKLSDSIGRYATVALKVLGFSDSQNAV